MTARELREWHALELLDPWGEDMADVRHAELMALLYNAHFGGKSRGKTPADFLPGRYKLRGQEPDDSIGRTWRAMNAKAV